MKKIVVFFCLCSAVLCVDRAYAGAKGKEMTQHQLEKTYPIVKCSFVETAYEKVLMSQLRDVKTTTEVFRKTTAKLGNILVSKVVECIQRKPVSIQTPMMPYTGEMLDTDIDLVSILRSGDALVGPFLQHFPSARISKILIQRDEATAKPVFKYMKLSPTIAKQTTVIILDPMLATGGTIDMAIAKLKEKGVLEDHMVVASIVAAPEGVLRLAKKYPSIRVVFIAFDEKLNEKKYILPGLGDFGDRYFNPE